MIAPPSPRGAQGPLPRAFENIEKNRKFFQFFSEKPLTNSKLSAIISSVENSGASPSGKATDSDSVIS